MAKRYIDEALVNAKLKEICDDYATSYGKKYGGRAEMFARLTEDIPTADVVEVKHGCWKVRRQFTSIGGSRFKDCICTNCGYNTNFYVDESEMPKFCPNCGAKMDGKNGGDI